MPVRNGPWPAGSPCWADCQVDDVQAARRFYAGLFGWDIQEGPEEAGGYLMAM
ncbi:VOC family protein, partial [Arthrobacter deserti]|nr:VOC family protein [Arthrobacter deserti]